MLGSDRSEDIFGGAGVDYVTSMGGHDVFPLDHINASALNAKLTSCLTVIGTIKVS